MFCLPHDSDQIKGCLAWNSLRPRRNQCDLFNLLSDIFNSDSQRGYSERCQEFTRPNGHNRKALRVLCVVSSCLERSAMCSWSYFLPRRYTSTVEFGNFSRTRTVILGEISSQYTCQVLPAVSKKFVHNTRVRHCQQGSEVSLECMLNSEWHVMDSDWVPPSQILPSQIWGAPW